MSKEKVFAVVGATAGVIALLLWLVLFFGPWFIRWEAHEAQKHLVEKAKAVAVTQAKIDTAAIITGHFIHEIKNFKKKVKMEVILEDSTADKK